MMKKLLLFAVMLVAGISANAQNVQVHYDLGDALYDDLSDRFGVTSTVEMYKPDKWGSTFGFIDFNYKRSGVKTAYMEIYRELALSKNKRFAAHVEYNGGFTSTDPGYYALRFQHAFLAGPSYNWANKDFTRTFSAMLLYKYYFSGQNNARPFNGFQATTTWGIHFNDGMFSFAGFADVWYDQKVRGNLIFISQPQFWFNFNSLKGMKDVNLSVGTEVELSNNYIFSDEGKNNKFYAIPTIGAKWTF